MKEITDKKKLELEESIQFTLSELKSDNSNIRWNGASFCGLLSDLDPRIIEALIVILQNKNEDMFVQIEAMEALANQDKKDPRFVEVIKGFLNHPHPLAQITAKESLEKMTGEDYGFDQNEKDEAYDVLGEMTFIQGVINPEEGG